MPQIEPAVLVPEPVPVMCSINARNGKKDDECFNFNTVSFISGLLFDTIKIKKDDFQSFC